MFEIIRKLRPAVGVCLVPIAALTCSGCYTFASVGAGEMAVVHTESGIQPTPLGPGDYHLGYFDNATLYTVRSQEREERLDVLSSDGLQITLDTSIRYHAVPGEVVPLHTEIGPDYYGVLLGPILRSQARRVVGRFRPEEIYSTEREAIEKQIRDGVEAAIAGRHVALEAVLIRNVTLPAAIQAAIDAKLEKEQAALKMKYVEDEQRAQDRVKLMQATDAAEQAKIAAQAAADVSRIGAQAAAEAKRTEGQALADYQKSVQRSLTPEILRLREIEANQALAESPSAKFIFGASGARTLIDLRGAGSGSAAGY